MFPSTHHLHPPFIPVLSLCLTTAFLTLDEVQFRQEFEFFGDVQLEVSEGWISIQNKMLEILNCFTQPGAGGTKHKNAGLEG